MMATKKAYGSALFNPFYSCMTFNKTLKQKFSFLCILYKATFICFTRDLFFLRYCFLFKNYNSYTLQLGYVCVLRKQVHFSITDSSITSNSKLIKVCAYSIFLQRGVGGKLNKIYNKVMRLLLNFLS